MAWDINRVVLVGRLTTDIDVKHSNNGSSFAKVSVAVGGKDAEAVSFFDCVLFGTTADNAAKYTKKGSQICVEGKLNQSRWETEDGSKRSRVEILVDRLQFLNWKNGENNGGEKRGQSPAEMHDNADYDNDFAPF